ncbi:MAG: type II toxin-antitoxin system RelE/ParE family toxin [Planctomycetales bacterium]
MTLLPAAEEEFAAIYKWLAERSPTGAARWFNRFTDALLSLESEPLRCGLAPEGEFVEREIRQILFQTKRGRAYRALFVVINDSVFVLHIRGSGQPLMGPDEL